MSDGPALKINSPERAKPLAEIPAPVTPFTVVLPKVERSSGFGGAELFGILGKAAKELVKVPDLGALNVITPADIKNLETISRLLAVDKFGGVDGRFNYADIAAIKDCLLKTPEIKAQITKGILAAAADKINFRDKEKEVERRPIGKAIVGAIAVRRLSNEGQMADYRKEGEAKASAMIDLELITGLKKSGQPLPPNLPTSDLTARKITMKDTEDLAAALAGLKDLQGRIAAQYPNFPQPDPNKVDRKFVEDLLTQINTGKKLMETSRTGR